MHVNQRNNVMDNFVANIEQEMVFYPKRNVNKTFKVCFINDYKEGSSSYYNDYFLDYVVLCLNTK